MRRIINGKTYDTQTAIQVNRAKSGAESATLYYRPRSRDFFAYTSGVVQSVLSNEPIVIAGITVDSERLKGIAARYGWRLDVPVPDSGYCYASSQRYPRAPETVIRPDCDYRYVGRCKIDGMVCNTWRHAGRKCAGHPRYIHQTAPWSAHL